LQELGKKENVFHVFSSACKQTNQNWKTTGRKNAALVGFKDIKTGATLLMKSSMFGVLDFPDPVIESQLEPKTQADLIKMGSIS